MLAFERVPDDVPLKRGDFWVGHNNDPNKYEHTGESWKPISEKCYGKTPDTNDPYVNINNGAYWRPIGLQSEMCLAVPISLEVNLTEEHSLRLHNAFGNKQQHDHLIMTCGVVDAAFGIGRLDATHRLLEAARNYADMEIIAKNPGLQPHDIGLTFSVHDFLGGYIDLRTDQELYERLDFE